MSSKYDSVLKEKKIYEEVIDDRPFFRRHIFSISFFSVLTILIISFVIYFFTILSPARIVFDNIIDFFSINSIVYERNLFDDEFLGKYNFYGDIMFDLDTNYNNNDDILFLKDLNIKYSYLDNGDNRELDISSDKYFFDYYEDNNKGYLNYDNNHVKYNLDDAYYYVEDYENIFNVIGDLFYNKLKTLQFKKSVFLSDGKIVVSIDINFDGKIVNEIYSDIVNELEKGGRILPNILKRDKLVNDDAKFQLNIKNDIFKNNLVNLKLVINESNYRGVLIYEDNTFTYNDDDNEYKCVLKMGKDDFSIRFYEGSDMKYILSGKDNVNSYVYTYQVINVVDNISLQIKKDNKKNDYVLNIKKQNDDKYLNLLVSISMNYNNYVTFDKQVEDDDYKLYDELGIDDKKQIDSYVYRLFNVLSNLYDYVK